MEIGINREVEPGMGRLIYGYNLTEFCCKTLDSRFRGNDARYITNESFASFALFADLNTFAFISVHLRIDIICSQKRILP